MLIHKLEQDPRSKQDLQALVNKIAWKIRCSEANKAGIPLNRYPRMGYIWKPLILIPGV